MDFGTYRLWMAARAALYLRPGGVGKSELIGWLFRKVEVAAGRSNVCKAKMEIYRARKNGLQNIVKKDPDRAKQSS